VASLALFYVVPDGFGGCCAYGAVEGAGCPEGFAPELCLNPVPAFLTDSPGAGSLEAADYLGRAVVLAGAHEDVDVVWPELQGVDDHTQSLSRLLEALGAGLPHHPVPEDWPPVLGGELKVVVGLADAVMTPYQLHTITSPRRRGGQPPLSSGI